MWKEVVHVLLGPVAYAWVRARVRRDGDLAMPSGPAISHASGPDPDRVLVMGAPIVRGLGVMSYDLSVLGHLARRLSFRTGRGADVEARAIARFDARRAAEVVRRENLARFDVVLIMMGIHEILSLTPMSKFARDLRQLLAAVAEVATPARPVLIAGVAPFMQDMNVPRFAVAWMKRRIVRQNAETRRACEESGAAQYVPFTPDRAGIRFAHEASAIYESWAVILAPAVERALAERGSQAVAVTDERARQRALDDLGVLDTDRDATVDHIVEMARDMLGMDAASLNFIDHDRQWSKAAAGIEPANLPRDEAICNTTIQRAGVYVIEDLDADPAFRDSTWVAAVDHVRFYAGYPLEAPGGERIGALCVMDRTPRQFSDDETATLRDLALRAQAVLWEQRAG